MRVAVLGGCQAHGYAHAFSHLLDEAEVESFEAVVARNNGALDAAAAALHGYDIVFTQDLGADFGPLATAALSAALPRLHRLPIVAFDGYQPDMIYLALDGKVFGSPLGAYHSAIVAAAFSLGVAEADVAQLFNRMAYARLGYYEAFGKARTLLLRTLRDAHGLDMAAAFESWHVRGPFMYTINHPRGFVLADLARAVAAQAGVLRAEAPAFVATPPYDQLAEDTIWPVYPELAEALGVPGGLLFKRIRQPVAPLANSAFIGLPRLIRESYVMYRQVPEAAFREGEAGRIRAALAALLD